MRLRMYATLLLHPPCFVYQLFDGHLVVESEYQLHQANRVRFSRPRTTVNLRPSTAPVRVVNDEHT